MHLRIGGVPEHFNLPWQLAIERGVFDELGVTAEWIDFPGGTGEIMTAFADGEIDLATPLTEGAVTAIANGNPARIVRLWVESPLLWGVHVAADSPAKKIDDLVGRRFAISRFGSGSELMSRVMAEDHDWELTDESWVVVGDLEGALAALPSGEAEIFLWNKSMTQPHVDDGTLRRVGVVPTPWPGFAVVAAEPMLADHAELIGSVIDAAAAGAGKFRGQDDAAHLVACRFGLAEHDAAAWLDQAHWAEPAAVVSSELIESIIDRMKRLGRIDGTITSAEIIA